MGDTGAGPGPGTVADGPGYALAAEVAGVGGVAVVLPGQVPGQGGQGLHAYHLHCQHWLV